MIAFSNPLLDGIPVSFSNGTTSDVTKTLSCLELAKIELIFDSACSLVCAENLSLKVFINQLQFFMW
jgi:hypothetical protein